MISPSTIFLLILFILGYIGKNQSIMLAVYILFGIKLLKLDDKVFPYLEAKGISIGVTVITIAVLVPIATGEIGFKELWTSVKSYYGWIALGAGAFVALIAKNGLTLLADDPQLTTALVIGTILAVVFFNGVAVGPLIGAGIAYMTMKIVDTFLKIIG
ncbi:membrane protein [Pontibacillus halophilus JSM 076056 = DSM 19796]|uniref:UPF0756 membrane protein N781_10010 n=1 Tax=Pontibacillus halophilus JSM 076056 = DSM 19796 TaxID=1385510 RepID=A0A0A5GJE9_9BACI|nr:DUF441 domain-containing protein [Pontibacillus halophilus]KGX93381.1 membrane protein [Pontibacillus halophilus JSM 076056 = DSM 19796]